MCASVCLYLDALCNEKRNHTASHAGHVALAHGVRRRQRKDGILEEEEDEKKSQII